LPWSKCFLAIANRFLAIAIQEEAKENIKTAIMIF
jgi:hypothetical protein